MKIFKLIAILYHFLYWACGIVNPNNETARMVIYLQKPSSLGPRTWMAGVNCLDQLAELYFKKLEKLLRAPNVVMAVAMNMSTPAAQIQEGFLKLMMEAEREKNCKKNHYQLRVVSNAKPYKQLKKERELVVMADYYVLVVDSTRLFKDLMRDHVSHMVSWNPGARFMILYTNVEEHDKKMEITRDIFQEMLTNYYVHRVALLYAIADTSYELLLLDYFNSTSCRTLTIPSYAKCDEGDFKPDLKTLENKLEKFFNTSKLNNCTFKMCASIAAPFVEDDCVAGLEMRIIGFIKKRLLFNVDETCGHENRGIELENKTWTGLLGRLNKKSCDFVLGGFYPDNEVINTFWTSDTYLEDSYTWYVKLADPRPAWLALYAIFQQLTWVAFIVMLLISWLVWTMLVKLLPEPAASKEWSLTAINSLAVSICVSVNERPLCVASRIFFFSLALYGLNVTSTYTSKLIEIFGNPGFLHQIDTLEEVVKAGIPFGGEEENKDWFEDDKYINETYESSGFEPTTENFQYVRRGERVILSSRMFILQNPLVNDVFAFPRNVFSSPMQMIMKPGFPFLYEFNKMIRFMRDFGFFAKINNDFVYNNTYLNRIAKMRPDFQEKVIVLTPDHLQGPFAILIVGICLSIGFFLAELIVFFLCMPCMQKYWKSGQPKTSLTNKTKMREKRKRQAKKASKRKYHKRTQEIVIAWNEINQHQDVRLTPLKRRIIHK